MLFSNGLTMDGVGVFTRDDGLKYEGEFQCNVPMGKGTYTWPDGSSYEGDVYNAIRHGEGKYIYSTNNVTYQGQWYEGVMHGKGTMFYNEEKTSWYKGDWEKNKREGVGDRRYTSGNFYSGEWKNNLRHGEGTMKWVTLGQQYEGEWQNGVQHGEGTHVWIVRRSDGSQYSQRNRYKGDFVNGQRHGRGTFYYADGSIYEGQWKNNSKHGQGKFTSSDGRVFEGDFVNDQMMKTSLNGNGSLTPVGISDLLRPDIVLNIDDLLKKIPEEKRDVELQQVKFVLLEHDKELKSIYSFYSRLGHGPTLDNTFLLSRLQLWQLLKDCNIHQHGITLSMIDHHMKGDDTAEIHSPFTTVLFDELLNCLVMVAHQIYSKDMMNEEHFLAACLSKLFTHIILPNAKNVKGFLFRQPSFAVAAMKYVKRCWGIYQAFSNADHPMTCRHFLWMFKDLRLLDDNVTTMRIIQIISDEKCQPQNLSSFVDLEMTFLEFFEVLLWSAEMKFQRISNGFKEDNLQSDSEVERDRPEEPQDKDEEFEDKDEEFEDKDVEFQDKDEEFEDKDMCDVSAEDAVNEEVQIQMNEKFASAGHREDAGVENTETELEVQTIHQFFNHLFFPAVNHHQEVTRNMKGE
ncbi:radial spoke head 10 homolog B isoform X2 [Gouania willdenowi]|uniref:radial spoke head 10 homolog B isoform X2 n=1 Tax=Gouania willdenowi TaxID=441366 RepID=UPI0010566A81|nr:radial spoke head 10 homolog B2 isoform X2 [Gouania willdenowi]